MRQYVETEASNFLNGRLTIGALTGNLFEGVSLENVVIAVDDRPVVSIPRLRLEYNLINSVSRSISIHRIVVDRPTITVEHDPSGWSVSNLVKKEGVEADRTGPARPFTADSVIVTGGSIIINDDAPSASIVWPRQVDDLDAELSFAYEPVRYSMTLASLSFRTSDPSLVLNRLSGTITVRDDTIFGDQIELATDGSMITIDGAVHDYLSQPRLDLRLRSDRTSFAELGRLVPSMSRDITPSFRVVADGPLDRLSLVVDTRMPGAWAAGRVVLDVLEPDQSVSGELSVKHLDLANLIGTPEYRSDINADISGDLRAGSVDRCGLVPGPRGDRRNRHGGDGLSPRCRPSRRHVQGAPRRPACRSRRPMVRP